jgi:signal transduction histidine kinase
MDLNKEIRDTVQLATFRFACRIQAHLDPNDLPEFVSYPQLFNHVFLNILVKGARAIDSAGKIIVSTTRDKQRIHISITYKGHGMTPEQTPASFRPDSQQSRVVKVPVSVSRCRANLWQKSMAAPSTSKVSSAWEAPFTFISL